MNNKEIEFKYSARHIPLDTFTAFCKRKNPESHTVIAGYDHFYSNKNDKDSFFRYRTSCESKQLTFKRKTEKTNSFIRSEYNIDLGAFSSKETIDSFLKEMSYDYNTSIFKVCFIYFYPWYTLSYYICYNDVMVEVGRFIEIEMKEDHNWLNEQAAMQELIAMEKVCKDLGIGKLGRISESLFEMYRKGDV